MLWLEGTHQNCMLHLHTSLPRGLPYSHVLSPSPHPAVCQLTTQGIYTLQGISRYPRQVPGSQWRARVNQYTWTCCEGNWNLILHCSVVSISNGIISLEWVGKIKFGTIIGQFSDPEIAQEVKDTPHYHLHNPLIAVIRLQNKDGFRED